MVKNTVRAAYPSILFTTGDIFQRWQEELAVTGETCRSAAWLKCYQMTESSQAPQVVTDSPSSLCVLLSTTITHCQHPQPKM